ncbi:GGDEF domain-containing protein [Photobacterium lipolyticum]|uniref:diguanylate cyclase n=1 Tax=Photobacterium lipolyticum TaxID=266810 RepID=A0A2T3MSY9_9GAMM|nr:GGDEF domain-containing protein [Photobacterium lipolyticum]PSW01675.1 GGDEF domain-containing protein [Photobacterium lipolyticum]
MTDINAVASEVSKLKQRLDQAQLSYRDASLKSRREIVILKRLITRLSVAYRGLDSELDTKLTELRTELDQPKDISKLIPRLAVIERLVTRQAGFTEKENQRLEQQIHQSGETLKRVHGLPAQLKRELRNILSATSDSLAHNHQRILRLLELYERSLKLISTSNDNLVLKDTLDHDLQLQLTNELQHLITELDFDGESGDKLLTIRNRLLIGVPPQTLIELSLEVLRLVLNGTHQERRSSQKFLDSVNSDLATLQKTTNQNVGQTSALYAHHGELTTELATVVNTVKQGLQDQKNLENWRPTLTELTKELQVLVDRNRALEKREKMLIEQLSYNENKVTTLFEQTQDYRQRLNDQERKMFLDHLTKVYNRAALNDRLEHEYRRWLRYQHPLCVSLIDIDDFKDINDSYGHIAGDKALKIIARTIHQCLEETDFIARFDGDEFVVIMPDVSEEERNKRLNKVRESISQLPFRFRDQNVTISISIGATLFEGNDTPTDIIERTEKALYSAKSAGRNRMFWIL